MTLTWCSKQKRGIRIIEPNDNLAQEYIQSAEESLEVLRRIESTSNMWVATIKYYAE